MGCGRIRKKFIAYLEGSLPDGDRRDFEAHIESCPGCAAEIKGLSATAHMLRAGRPDAAEPPPGFVSRVAVALGEGRARSPWAQRWAPATASAVVVAGLVAALVIGNWHRLSAPQRMADELAPQPTVTAVVPDDMTREPIEAGEDAGLPEEAAGVPQPTVGPTPAGTVEPTHIADASPGGLYGVAGGGGPAGPAFAAADGEESADLIARPVSVGPYNSDDEASRIEEAMALFGY